MAEVTSAGKPIEAASTPATKKRVTRPDKEEFNKKLDELNSSLKEKEKLLETARANVKAVLNGGGPKNEERDQLKEKLNELKQKQTVIKNSRGKVLDEVKSIDEKLKKKIKDLQQSKSKVDFKSIEELDAHIKKQESQVDSGNLRLVDEKRILAEVTSLKKARKNFEGFASTQVSIDADKAKIASLKASLDNSEANQISNQYNEVVAKLDSIRDENQKASKNRNALFDSRTAAEKDREQVRQQIKQLKDDYFGQVRAFQEQVRSEIAARHEREKAERDAAEKDKRKRAAEAKLEAASEPAFASQIGTAENLLIHFDPTYKPEQTTLVKKSTLAAHNARAVNAIPEGAKVIKKDFESYFVGNATKKNRKKTKEDTGKFSLNVSVVEGLASLNISVPTSKEDVPNTIESIKKKIVFYRENEERVTGDRIENAKSEIAKLEAEADAAENAKEEEPEETKGDATETTPSETAESAKGEESAPSSVERDSEETEKTNEDSEDTTTGEA